MSKFSEQFVPNIDFYALKESWLIDRMLFIAGPRQVGKTSYAHKKIKELGGSYFNWDDKKVIKSYRKDSDFFIPKSQKDSLVVFDEIHKQNKWKDILKGIYDVNKDDYRFVITGSARLDTFKKSGDSLVGRYFLTHILPISIGDLISNNFKEQTNASELVKAARATKPTLNSDEFNSLLRLGGFPEPFFSGSESLLRRWQKQHQELLIREDLRDLTRIQDLEGVSFLVDLLKLKVSSTCSYNSLVQDLEVDFKTVKRWISQLEKLMMVFTIKPWSKKIQNSIKKNPKIYFYNWTVAKDDGARFENFIAMHLYKATVLWNDRFGFDFELFFIKIYNDQEIDFLITYNSQPWLLIEVKSGKPKASDIIHQLKADLKIPALILTKESNWNHNRNGVTILDYRKFLSVLP